MRTRHVVGSGRYGRTRQSLVDGFSHTDPNFERVWKSMFTIQQLRSLVATANLGTMQAAAGSLNVDDSTVSKHIGAIERRAGRRVLRRSMSRCVVEPDDALLVEAAGAAVCAYDAFVGIFESLRGGPPRDAGESKAGVRDDALRRLESLLADRTVRLDELATANQKLLEENLALARENVCLRRRTRCGA